MKPLRQAAFQVNAKSQAVRWAVDVAVHGAVRDAVYQNIPSGMAVDEAVHWSVKGTERDAAYWVVFRAWTMR